MRIAIWTTCWTLLFSGSPDRIIVSGQDARIGRLYPFSGAPLVSPPQLELELQELAARLAGHRSAQFHFERGLAYLGAGRQWEALEEFGVSQRLLPLSPWPRLARASVHARLGQQQAARLLLAELASEDGEAVSCGRILTAFLLQEGGLLPESESLLDPVLQVDPDNGWALYLSGLNQMQLNQHAGALARFEKAMLSNPAPAAAFLQAGSLQRRGGQNRAQALANLREARRRGLDSAELAKELGLLLFQMEDFGQARAELERALESDPDFAEAHYVLAQVLERLGESSGADQHLQRYQALQLARTEKAQSAELGLALYSAALGQLEQSRLEEAFRGFEQALESGFEADAAYYGMAHIRFRQRRLQEATGLAREALRLNPHHADALILLSECLEGRREYREAADTLRKACLLSPGRADLFNHWGNLAMNIQDFTTAVEAYRQAVQLDADNAFYHLNLSAALKRTGDDLESRKAHETYLKLSR